jgi:hypothetical protein
MSMRIASGCHRQFLIARAAFLQIGKADPTRDQVHGTGIWYT